jgi:hypothetical protein
VVEVVDMIQGTNGGTGGGGGGAKWNYPSKAGLLVLEQQILVEVEVVVLMTIQRVWWCRRKRSCYIKCTNC